ncbi:hypothetical protein NMY25_001796 [Wohlfahrtiimonas chitiniclastica]|nr:hypothetical protein [Wohlfahrtiimonas chitiniclastica]
MRLSCVPMNPSGYIPIIQSHKQCHTRYILIFINGFKPSISDSGKKSCVAQTDDSQIAMSASYCDGLVG